MTVSLAALALVLGAAAPQPADQEPAADGIGFATLDSGLRHLVVSLPGSRHQCLALMFRVGHDHDPAGATGLAAVVGVALDLAQESVAERQRVRVQVRGPYTLLWATAPVGEVDGRVRFLEAVLGGTLELDDDLLERAKAIAVLQADDASVIFPGPVLRQRAQRALLAGTPQGRQTLGIPREIRALSPDDVRRRLARAYRPRHAILVSLGGAGSEPVTAWTARLAALAAGEDPDPEPAVHDPLPPPETETASPHVDGPFVTAALRAPVPGSPDHLPFLLATEMVRARAVLVFQAYRGGESQARFPFVEHGFMAGDRLALLNRRGENGGSADDVRAELTRFLASLREAGITARAVRAAGRAVALALSLPPYQPLVLGPMLEQPDLLLPRAVSLCLYELRGWPRDLRERIGAVPPSAVQAALEAYYDPGQLSWFALLPRDSGGSGPGAAPPGRRRGGAGGRPGGPGTAPGRGS